MTVLEGVLEAISDQSLTRFGKSMCNITVDGVRMGKFFRDQKEVDEFFMEYNVDDKVKIEYSTNGKWKNLESIQHLNKGERSEQVTLPEEIDRSMAKAALKASSRKIVDSVTGEDWSKETVVKQLKKDIKNIREMMVSMEKLCEVL